ncbi:uncharacterized protein LOC128233817 [Mya arenaria]|uniref:uncharacterized protein LOC128233817 n=1 Tax=Mya arenaria TaxID=6604 RepID=UPI0022E64933|nr:uncharacterized protein LOC128233817 [Mya arenaria]
MYKHQDSLIVLRKARKACWKSEGKLIIATQKCSDRQNQTDVDVRPKALKKLESILERKQVKHQQNVETFMESFKNEFTLRKSVLEQAQRLESLILAEMEAAITLLMNTNRQDISAEQVADFARLIYGKTSRAYCFKNALPELCLKERVLLSTFDTSRINRKGMLRLSA